MGTIYASMKSIASYIPSNCVSNFDFEKTLDTSDEWITDRTGIKSRYFADSNESSSDLGAKAASIAIQRANLKPSDIDLVICATLSPDYLAMPSNACLISYKLGIENKPAFDISSACSGFVYLISLAKSYIESGIYNNVLIVGAEKLSSILDFEDRSTCVLFGDGAGAAIIGSSTNRLESIIDVHIGANGKYSDLLFTPRCLNKDSNHNQFINMKGNSIFKIAVKTLVNDVLNILEKNHISSDEIDFFVPHQANLRIINAVGEMLKIESKKIVLTVNKYGNTSAASIPMAIDDIYSKGLLKKGDLLLLDAFGGGLTWGSCLVYFNGN